MTRRSTVPFPSKRCTGGVKPPNSKTEARRLRGSCAEFLILQNLQRHFGYARNCDLAAVFFSRGQTEDTILASIIFQLIKNESRAHSTQSIIDSQNLLLSGIKSQKPSITGIELSNHLWRLLEAVVKGAPGCETIFLLDGLDELKRDTRSTFLRNFLSLEKRTTSGGATIRVIISSKPYEDIREALAHYTSIEPHKEEKDCLQTLYFREWNARETRIDAVKEGGSWLASHQEYLKWIESSNSDLLWIEGKPGSGKSTLSKRIVQKLQEEPIPKHGADLHQDTTIAAFYYSFRGGITETSHELMLRSIVYQKENAEDIRGMVARWFKEDARRYGMRYQNENEPPPEEKGYSPYNFLELKNYIVENSQGTHTMASLEGRVRKLPKDLGGPDGFYRQIVQFLIRNQDADENLNEEDKNEERTKGRIILNWVTFTKRPISMFELEDVLATPLETQAVDFSRYDIRQNRPLELTRGLISYCGGLLETCDTQFGQTVQLIHQTVREFLLDKEQLAKPYDLDEANGDRMISMMCCSNIRITFAAAAFQLEVDHNFSQIHLVTARLCENNLLQYSLSFFAEHLTPLGDSGLSIREEFSFFIRDIMSRPTCYSALLLSKWIISYWSPEEITGLNQTNSERCLQSALIYAALNGRDEALGILLIRTCIKPPYVSR
ncbi:hypothetical protein F5Y13DRAFT_202999 [Hypoxylon sp. FL1857]|nr:hypothetical protein F5Y13DRAFT_202999 [Hypoxylon sp. FL1857]